MNISSFVVEVGPSGQKRRPGCIFKYCLESRPLSLISPGGRELRKSGISQWALDGKVSQERETRLGIIGYGTGKLFESSDDRELLADLRRVLHFAS